MKIFMLLASMFMACTISFSQQRDLYELKKRIEKKKQPLAVLPPQLYRIPHIGSNSNINSGSLALLYPEDRQATLESTLPNGNRIYSLPQDNMACIVPEMDQFNMPVTKPVLDGTMPNGSRLYKLIPQ